GRQVHGLIRELQPLDVGEAVGGIENVLQSTAFGGVTCFWYGSAGDQMPDHGDAGDGVEGDAVVGGDVSEKGGVEARLSGHELAHDDELAGVIGAVDHQRLQRFHAVEAGDLRPGAIEVLAHADARVEPHIAVEQVAAAAALEDVAAVTTEDNVAAVKLIVGRAKNAVRAGSGAHRHIVGRAENAVKAWSDSGDSEERPQAADEVKIGERAALDAVDGE